MSQTGLGRVGPAQSDLLIHFCGRPSGRKHTPWVPPEIQNVTAAVRLDLILTSGQLKGFPPFGADPDQSTVCLSESPPQHLVHLLGRGWQPWGLLFHRQWVYDQGGEPVAYVREARWNRRKREDQPWTVRLEADRAKGWSDWTHEREWRIPLSPERPYLALTPESIAGILVGDPFWKPAEVPSGHYINQATGEIGDGSDPFDESWPGPNLLWTSASKWLWSPSTGLSAPAV